MTTKPLQVLAEGDAGPYIVVPVDQIDEVCALLDAHNISYWVDEEAYSFEGEPEVTFFNLKYGTDAAAVQKILDA